MQVGQKVWAYNTKTHQMELEPVLHVWINHDNVVFLMAIEQYENVRLVMKRIKELEGQRTSPAEQGNGEN